MLCICLLALYSKKYDGRILSSSASMAFNGSVEAVGYLKLPMELHAKVISLLEIGHIVSKPMVLESVLFLYLLHIKALIDIAHESVICEKKP